MFQSHWIGHVLLQVFQCDRTVGGFFFHQEQLGGGFKHFLFLPLPGEMIQFDKHIFQMGWNHQLEKAV